MKGGLTLGRRRVTLSPRGSHSAPCVRERRTRAPAASDRATTRSESTAAQSPDSTAVRTASFDGNSSWTLRSDNLSPNFLRAASNIDLVPEPGSRKIHLASVKSLGAIRAFPIHGWLGP